MSTRWYTSEPAKEGEAAKTSNGDEANKSNGNGNGQESELDVLKKQLEAKDAEARDWKVRTFSTSEQRQNQTWAFHSNIF